MYLCLLTIKAEALCPQNSLGNADMMALKFFQNLFSQLEISYMFHMSTAETNTDVEHIGLLSTYYVFHFASFKFDTIIKFSCESFVSGAEGCERAVNSITKNSVLFIIYFPWQSKIKTSVLIILKGMLYLPLLAGEEE